MNKEQKEAFKAVEKANDKLFKKYDKNNELDYLPIFTIVIAGNMFFITLSIPDNYNSQEINIFNSENNDRIYYEKSDKYETFNRLIKRKFLEAKEEIYDVKW